MHQRTAMPMCKGITLTALLYYPCCIMEKECYHLCIKHAFRFLTVFSSYNASQQTPKANCFQCEWHNSGWHKHTRGTSENSISVEKTLCKGQKYSMHFGACGVHMKGEWNPRLQGKATKSLEGCASLSMLDEGHKGLSRGVKIGQQCQWVMKAGCVLYLIFTKAVFES